MYAIPHPPTLPLGRPKVPLRIYDAQQAVGRYLGQLVQGLLGDQEPEAAKCLVMDDRELPLVQSLHLRTRVPYRNMDVPVGQHLPLAPPLGLPLRTPSARSYTKDTGCTPRALVVAGRFGSIFLGGLHGPLLLEGTVPPTSVLR